MIGAAVDFGGTITDVVLRRAGADDLLVALPGIPEPSAADVERVLLRALERLGVGLEKIRFVAVTGGRSALLPETVGGITLYAVDETAATAAGAALDAPVLPAVVASLGTGTGIVIARPPDEPIRLIGSGIGGGTLLGLGQALLGTSDPSEIGRLALAGDASRCDLTVGDLVGGGVGPVGATATASHFGRVARDPEGVRREDLAAALLKLIAQTLLRIALEPVFAQQARAIVLLGHVLDVPGFRETIESTPGMVPGFVHFAHEPGFAVARGALEVAYQRRRESGA
ncbi:MAG: hypothetical protein FJ144_09865 [Deltaproteobacteria bacterium]|nr:hypothetical protein [Deltaproteobacteria bacterium]